MKETALRSQFARPNANLLAIAKKVCAQPALLTELFAGLNAAQPRVKYGCLKMLRRLSQQKPELLYPHFDTIAALLDAPNNIVKWNAILILGDLAPVDARNKIDPLLDRFLQPIAGPVMITAANTIAGAAQIALAKPALLNQILPALMRVETAQYQTAECRNVVLGHTLKALDLLFARVSAPEPVLEFVQRQLRNRRNAVKVRAAKFLRKHAANSKSEGGAVQPASPLTRRSPRSLPVSQLLAAALLAVSWFLFAPSSQAVSVLPEELAEMRRWTTAKLDNTVPETTTEPALLVQANHDPVQKNSRAGKPLRLGDHQYTRGLYCHAFSRILVRLPGPGSLFTAIIGVDSNEQTSGGRGSVEFSVHVHDTEKFRSGMMRESSPAKTVRVDLENATEFVLQIDPTADGIACDQADWAEAKVMLADGRELWLADLPLRTAERPAYTTELPFSFRCDGKPSAEWIQSAQQARNSRQLDPQRQEQTLTWTDPATGLQLRWVAVRYADFPIVEWTLHFQNTGTNPAPLLSNVLPLDTPLHRLAPGDFLLHHHKGTFVRADDFQPLTTPLRPGEGLRFAPPAGRPLGHVFPYFNLELAPAEGLIAVIGWPGQWFAEFKRDHASALRLTAGQEKIQLRLQPGESIRSPLIVLQFWRGDRLRAQNIWRRWMIAHNVPRPGNQPLAPQMAACSSHQFAEMIHANETNQIYFVDRYLEEELPLDYWWMDAGWYIMDSKTHPWGWPCTGTWEVDTKRFPRGLRAITDHAHNRGIKSIVWFEPERVAQGTWLYTNHPTWLLGADGQQKLLNLGHPEARRWAIDHFGNLIESQGVDLYRQDFNIDPLPYWRGNDSPERQGATENHYVVGYLAYWDALRQRFPNLVIDTCASGGHRNDLETLRRSLPLLRSDYILEPIGQQCHTYGLASWFPFFGTGTGAMDSYQFRSQMSPHFTACFDMRRSDLPFEEARRLLAQWKNDIAPNYFGDFYPLTPYSTADDVWIAWQFDSPENGTGVVQAFRRGQSFYESARLKLHALTPTARYRVTDLDGLTPPRVCTGAELRDHGLLMTAPTQPAALVITYQKT